jgi:hypothetical protein
MQPGYLLPYSQEPAISPYIELYESIPLMRATLPVHRSLHEFITLMLCSDEFKL